MWTASTQSTDSDAKAFEAFWELQRARLHRLCLRHLSGNHADADEALSRAMMKTWERLPSKANEIASVTAWTVRLTQNVCTDLLRERQSEARKAARFREETEVVQATTEQLGACPQSTLLLREDLDSELQQQVERLPERLRETFRLRLYQELPCDKIALRLGIAPANVRKRLQQARAALRRTLAGSPDQTFEAQNRAPEPGRQPCGPDWEIYVPTAFLRTLSVRLPCQVTRYILIGLPRRPIRERQKLAAVRAYVAQHPESRPKRQELARLLYQMGLWHEAVDACRQALVRQPGWLEGSLKLGEMLLCLGRHEQVLAVYEHALPLVGQPASRCHLSGLVSFCRRDFPQSAKAFQEAVLLESENPAHWHALARARLKAGFGEAGLLAIDAALRLNALDAVALSLGHDALLASGRATEAWQRLKHLLRIVPDCAFALWCSAEHRCRSNLTAGEPGLGTKRLIRRGFKAAPDCLALKATLARFFLSRGERERGLQLARQSAEQHPRCPRCRRDYLDALAAAGSPTIPSHTGDSPRGGPPCTGACALVSSL